MRKSFEFLKDAFDFGIKYGWGTLVVLLVFVVIFCIVVEIVRKKCGDKGLMVLFWTIWGIVGIMAVLRCAGCG